MRSRVNDMISATQRIAYTRRSNGRAFQPRTSNIEHRTLPLLRLISSFLLFFISAIFRALMRSRRELARDIDHGNLGDQTLKDWSRSDKTSSEGEARR